MLDIADEKRREVLERAFFEDLTHTASGIQGLVDVMSAYVGSPLLDPSLLYRVKHSVLELIDEIGFTKDVFMAEAGTLVVKPENFSIHELLERVAEFVASPSSLGDMSGKSIAVSGSDSFLFTDRKILFRVLMSLVKNAVEADYVDSHSLDGISMSVSSNREGALFEVHNHAVIEGEHVNEIFKRSFSTKGQGCGLGTYSARLFAERYLNGRIWFSSEHGRGTSFFVQVPHLSKK